MSRLTRALLVSALVGQVALPARAQEATLRATSDQLDEAAVLLVADQAPPIDLHARALVILADDTVAGIIARLCGSVRPGYLEAFAVRNAPDPPAPEAVVGMGAYDLVWPACLYAETLEGFSVEVQPNQTATEIFQAFTGGAGSQAQLTSFFGRTPAQLNNLQAGDRLPVPYVTAAVPVASDEAALTRLRAELVRLETRRADSALYRPSRPAAGMLVLGMISGAPEGCAAEAKTPPFDVAELRHALRFAKADGDADEDDADRQQVSIAVVDNGFFGAHPEHRFEGSPFDRAFFRSAGDSVVASVVDIGGRIEPLNDPGETPVDPVSGHGTHVAGLTLGGPAFRPFWSEVDSPKTWSRLTIINVGRGLETLVEGSIAGLTTPLADGHNIVNLSIAYDDRTDPSFTRDFNAIFERQTRTLFVVAAGNNSSPVGNVGAVPARLGGPGNPNVISVAAHAADGTLAPFSNHGSASVDLAAPGCGLQSWLDNTPSETPLDGTSQAAPLVTFAASLVKWLRPDLEPWEIKARLIASGDLMPDEETPSLEGTSGADRLAFRVRLNIPRALLLAEDFIRFGGEGGGAYLGDVQGLRISCGEAQFAERDLWAYKRETSTWGWAYAGRSDFDLRPPCMLDTGKQRAVEFVATHEIVEGEVRRLDPARSFHLPFSGIEELILRSRDPQ